MCRRTKIALSVIAGLLIAGCTKVRTVKVPVVRYVPIPAGLVQQVPIAEPENATVGECVRVARVRKAALYQCNKQLEEIGAIGP